MQLGTTQSESPEFQTLYGPGHQVMWALANTTIGRGGMQVSFRFRAQKGGQMQAFRVYIQGGSGYSAGDGGVLRFSIRRDNGSGLPTDRVLGSATWTPPSNALNAATFPRIDLSAPLVEGEVYHLFQENIHGNPGGNFISTNNAQIYKSAGHPHRWLSGRDWATLYRGNASSAWVDGTVNGDAVKYWSPILEIYTNNGSFGYSAMEGGSVQVRGNQALSPTLYNYSQPIRELFTPRRSITVEGFSFRYSVDVDDHYLDWEFDSQKGTIWTPWKNSSTQQVSSNTIQGGTWVDVEFKEPVPVNAGRQIPLVFTPRNGNIMVSDTRKGNSVGFSTWTESIGQRYLNGNWINWNHNHHNAAGSDGSWPVMLHLKA